MKFIGSLILCMFFFPSFVLSAEVEADQWPLTIYYLEFPPYYYTNANQEPDGFLLKEADIILRKAGIRPEYRAMPAKRIMQEMHSLKPLGSIGWFRTPRREGFAKFSLPIYRNQPLQIIYLKKHGPLFQEHDSLQDLLGDDRLILGLLEGYSYGTEIDLLIRRVQPPTRIVVGGYPQLVRMLAVERFTYIIVAPEEINVLIQKNHLTSNLFARKELSDVPAGNYRHLMFSKGVSDKLVDQVDRVINGFCKAKQY